MGPRGPRHSWRERFLSLRLSWHVLILFVVILGGIYAGFFTPFEAAAVGTVVVLLIGGLTRRLRLSFIWDALVGASVMTALIMFIFVFANALGQLLSLARLPDAVTDAIISLGLSHSGLLALFLAFYFVLGCIVNVIPAMILTLPLLFPALMAAGFDPIWLGVILTVALEIGLLTPPIGMNVFAFAAVQDDIPMGTIFRGVTPYWIAMLGVLVILALFPQISLVLPNLLYGAN